MIADLASSDLGKPLMASLGLLADVERKAQDIESEQAKQDLVTLMGTADEYARLINSVRVRWFVFRTIHAYTHTIHAYIFSLSACVSCLGVDEADSFVRGGGWRWRDVDGVQFADTDVPCLADGGYGAEESEAEP